MLKINMKDIRVDFSTIIIALVVFKMTDFSNLQILDYVIILLLAVLFILMIINSIRRRKNAKR